MTKTRDHEFYQSYKGGIQSHCKQQVPLVPLDARNHHRCSRRYHNDGYRTGFERERQKNISQMGTNIIMIRPGADMRGGVRQDPSEMQTLKIADYTSIKENTKFISYVSPEVSSSGQAIYGANNTSTSIYGESVEYLDIKQWNVEDGQMFTDEDIKKNAKVCVIGKLLPMNSFPTVKTL